MNFEENVPSAPLISILYREHAKHLNIMLKEENLSFGLHPLLIRIYLNEGISQEELAQFFHLNESTITRNLKKLEKKGYIDRIPIKRKKTLRVTKKGKKTAKKVMDYDEKWDEMIKKSLSEKEYYDFLDILKKISNNLI